MRRNPDQQSIRRWRRYLDALAKILPPNPKGLR